MTITSLFSQIMLPTTLQNVPLTNHIPTFYEQQLAIETNN